MAELSLSLGQVGFVPSKSNAADPLSRPGELATGAQINFLFRAWWGGGGEMVHPLTLG